MGLRKVLRKAASGFFPVADGQQFAEKIQSQPSPLDNAVVDNRDASSPVRARLAESDLDPDASGQEGSWYDRRRSSPVENLTRIRKRLVKKNPESEQQHGPEASQLLSRGPSLHRAESLMRRFDFRKRTTTKKEVTASDPRDSPVAPNARPVSLSQTKVIPERRHSDDGTRGAVQNASISLPRRFLSLRTPKPSAVVSEGNVREESNSESSANTVFNDQSQSPSPASTVTSRSSICNSIRTQGGVADYDWLSGGVGRQQLGRNGQIPRPLSPVSPGSAHLESFGQAITMGATPYGGIRSPMPGSDTSRDHSFVLRDSWCNQKMSKILEKAEEHSFIQNSIDTAPRESQGQQLLQRNPWSGPAQPSISNSPYIPNFSHRVLTPVTQAIAKIDLMFNQALKDIEHHDGTEEDMVLPLTAPKTLNYATFRGSTRSPSLKVDTSASRQTRPAASQSMLPKVNPAGNLPVVELPGLRIERGASGSHTESDFVNQWLEPSPTLQTTYENRHSNANQELYSLPRNETCLNLAVADNLLKTFRHEDLLPWPLSLEASPTTEARSENRQPVPTTEEMQAALTRSLNIPVPSSPTATLYNDFLSWSFSRSSEAKAEQPDYYDISVTPPSISSTEQLREAILEGKKRYSRQSKSYPRSTSITASGEERLEIVDKKLSTVPAPRLSDRAFEKHKKHYSVPELPSSSHGFTSIGINKRQDTGSMFKEMLEDCPPNTTAGMVTTSKSPTIPMRVSSLRNYRRISTIADPAPDLSAHPAFASRDSLDRHNAESPSTINSRKQWKHVSLHEGAFSEPSTPRTHTLTSRQAPEVTNARNRDAEVSMNAAMMNLKPVSGERQSMDIYSTREVSAGSARSSRTSFHTAAGSLCGNGSDSSTEYVGT